MIGRFERFSYAIFGISRCWHKITGDEMEKYGLKGAYAIYLTTLSHYNDGITATKLGELCNRDKSDVSRAISAMEARGFVKKEGISQTLYRARLTLTDEGKHAAEQIEQRAQLAVELAGQDLNDERRAIFYEALETISAHLQTLSEEGLPEA